MGEVKRLNTHYLPVNQIASGKPGAGTNPSDVASLLEWQVGQAEDPEQKVTLTMNLQAAMELARLLRRAGLAGL